MLLKRRRSQVPIHPRLAATLRISIRLKILVFLGFSRNLWILIINCFCCCCCLATGGLAIVCCCGQKICGFGGKPQPLSPIDWAVEDDKVLGNLETLKTPESDPNALEILLKEGLTSPKALPICKTIALENRDFTFSNEVVASNIPGTEVYSHELFRKAYAEIGAKWNATTKTNNLPVVTWTQRFFQDSALYIHNQLKGDVSVCMMNFANGQLAARGTLYGASPQEEDLCRTNPTYWDSLRAAELTEKVWPFGPSKEMMTKLLTAKDATTALTAEELEKMNRVLVTESQIVRNTRENGYIPLKGLEQQEGRAKVTIVAAVAGDIRSLF